MSDSVKKFVTAVVPYNAGPHRGRGVFLAYLDVEPSGDDEPTRRTYWTFPGGIFDVNDPDLVRDLTTRVTQQTNLAVELDPVPLYEDARHKTYLAKSFTGSLTPAPIVTVLAADPAGAEPDPAGHVSSKWAGFMELLNGPDADYNYQVMKALKVREGR